MMDLNDMILVKIYILYIGITTSKPLDYFH